MNGGSPQTRALPTQRRHLREEQHRQLRRRSSRRRTRLQGARTAAATSTSAAPTPPVDDAGRRQRHHHRAAGRRPARLGDVEQPGHGGTGNADLIGSGNSVLGLVANNFVRVYHPCSPEGVAADEDRPHRRRHPLARALVHGRQLRLRQQARQLSRSTARSPRSTAARSARPAARGFTKDYNYDDRLRYRSPPYFLEPIAASWHVDPLERAGPAALARGGRGRDLDEPDQRAPRRPGRRGARPAGRAASRSARGAGLDRLELPELRDLHAVEHVALDREGEHVADARPDAARGRGRGRPRSSSRSGATRRRGSGAGVAVGEGVVWAARAPAA